VPFSREIYIEESDFMESPPKGYHRLSPGQTVRLRHAYIVTCTSVVKDERGQIIEVRCSHDPATRGGAAPKGTRVDGTIHWVSAASSIDVEVRLYDRLFTRESPGDGSGDWLADLNPQSLAVVHAKAERSLSAAARGDRFQLERLGFFVVDQDAKPSMLVLNRTVPLKDSWAKVVAKAEGSRSEPSERRNSPARRSPAVVATPSLPLEPAAEALRETYGLSADDARIIAQEEALGALLPGAMVAVADDDHRKAVAGVLVNEVLGELRATRRSLAPFDGAAVAELVKLTRTGTISKAQAKEVLGEMFTSGRPPQAIVSERGLSQMASTEDLTPAIEEVLAENDAAVQRYRGGNANVFGALVGMVMKKTKGRANAKVVTDLLKARLG
jgi:glutaminyl-tRNA synthetase